VRAGITEGRSKELNQYELAVLYHPDLEVDLTKAEERVKKIITDNGGKVTAEDNWGKRKLAYAIKGNEHAVYVFYAVELPARSKTRLISPGKSSVSSLPGPTSRPSPRLTPKRPARPNRRPSAANARKAKRKTMTNLKKFLNKTILSAVHLTGLSGQE
jgi:ribosomal protein S6